MFVKENNCLFCHRISKYAWFTFYKSARTKCTTVMCINIAITHHRYKHCTIVKLGRIKNRWHLHSTEMFYGRDCVQTQFRHF